ncbi:MAG: S1 family peptidase [Myxococcales bacterium FL481]|nr:MAG: S1 family peptidase [Myxococcales bacterium FL481]
MLPLSWMLSLLTASLTETPADPVGTERIYGGEPVADGEFLPVVGVYVQHANKTELCTGTMLSPTVVLTAAHCLARLDDNSPPVNVFAGTSSSALEAQSEALRYAIHPQYCLPDDCVDDNYDIAYIILADGMDVGTIEPITNQHDYDRLIAAGASVTLVGYGSTESGEIGTKHKVTTAITKFSETGKEFYAGGDGKDSCHGDSGGPALVQSGGAWKLAGVLSRGYDCGQGGVYGVPFPVLCWLRDETDLDLLPGRCDQCECLDISAPADPPADHERGCQAARSLPDHVAWLGGVGLLGLARRRRARLGA